MKRGTVMASSASPAREILDKRFNFPRTELGSAERFAADHATIVRFCQGSRSWLVWNGKLWEKDNVRIHQLAKQTVRNLHRQAAEMEDDEQRRTWAKYALSCESAHHIHAMLTLAENEPGIPVTLKDLDSDPLLFNLVNGTLDLRDGKLREHRREDLITKIAPVIYDREAQCPTWLRFLHDVTAGDVELMQYLQRAVGYTLTGDTREQALFMLYGTGANGKTTFLEGLRAMFGEYAETTDF